MQGATALREHGAQDFESDRQAVSSIFLLLLIAADAAFGILHVVNRLSPLPGSSYLYHLGADGGYAEMFQYLKTYWIVIMLGALCSRRREPVYAAWMLLYGYLLCDDALRIHERAGGAIAAALSYQPALGLRAQDFGELSVSGVAGFVFLASISTMYLRATSEGRNVSKDLALLLGILVFFGVFVDMVHMLPQGRYLREALGIVEDGGEMLAMSVACWYVLKLLGRGGSAPTWLWQTALGMLCARRLRPG